MTQFKRVSNVLIPLLALYSSWANADRLRDPMDRAIAELSTPSTWAKEIPKVAGTRRKGGTLIIAIGIPVEGEKGKNWRAWWQRAACLAPEMRAVIQADGGIMAHIGEDPKNYPDDKAQIVHAGRNECANLFSRPDADISWVNLPFSPSGFPVPAYEVQPPAPVRQVPDSGLTPGEQAVAAALAVLGAPIDATTGKPKKVRSGLKSMDVANPDHAAIIGWHQAILRGDYEAWKAYAPQAAVDDGSASEEKFRLLRDTTPPKLWISPGPFWTTPDGIKTYEIQGCGKPRQFQLPYDIPVLRQVTPFRVGNQWVIKEPSRPFVDGDIFPCDTYEHD